MQIPSSRSVALVVGAVACAVVLARVLLRRAGSVAMQVRSDRALAARSRERAVLRRPAEGTLVVQGLVVEALSPAEGLVVVTRREFGCLGGPLVHDVPPFLLELEGGDRVMVEVGPDPLLENLHLLTERRPTTPVSVPPPTGGPESIRTLRGRVQVAGVRAADPGRMAPPARHSAVLTVLPYG